MFGSETNLILLQLAAQFFDGNRPVTIDVHFLEEISGFSFNHIRIDGLQKLLEILKVELLIFLKP